MVSKMKKNPASVIKLICLSFGLDGGYLLNVTILKTNLPILYKKGEDK
jgi:hypothetical protein